MKKQGRSIAPFIYLLVLLAVFSWALNAFGQKTNTIPYSQLVELFQNEQVSQFLVEGNSITLVLRTPINGKNTITSGLADPEGFRSQMQSLFDEQMKSGVLTAYDFVADKTYTPYDFILPLLVAGGVLLLAWTFIMARMNGAGGGNPMAQFGKARTVMGVPDNKKVTFDDVAGADEEKQELEEVVDFLRDPAKYTAMGARIPHGLLLVGPPGTGKTLLARATAGEAGVQFLSISGSDFVEMYVGVGASRVRDLFEQAKKLAPAIIFIDEIDAVGRKRGSGMGGGHDEREQTLNQLLVEMDGFGTTEGIIVLAATNRPDILDPALLRPGRFDRQIQVNRPDVKGREDILKVHAKNKRMDESVNLHTIARSTAGFTGADLSNLLNEAAILAARNNRPAFTMEDVDEAMMKILAGPAKKSHVASRRDLKTNAIQEAGHAIVMHALPTHDPVHQITIVPRGGAGGMTISLPTEDRSYQSKRYMEEQIVSLLGGRVAEKLMLGDISTGASNDIQRASQIARKMVSVYGMSDRLGSISFESGHDEIFIGRSMAQAKPYSEQVAAQIDEEVKSIIDAAYERCEDILSRDQKHLIAVAEFLLAHETMSAEEFEAVFTDEAAGHDKI